MKSKLIIMLALILGAEPVLAAVELTNLRMRAPIPGQTMSAGYFDIKNDMGQTVSIVKVSSDEAERVEMHATKTEDGMTSMERLDSVMLKAGQQFSFTQGGHHLMIFGPDPKSVASGEMDFVFELDDGTLIEETAAIEQLSTN